MAFWNRARQRTRCDCSQRRAVPRDPPWLCLLGLVHASTTWKRKDARTTGIITPRVALSSTLPPGLLCHSLFLSQASTIDSSGVQDSSPQPSRLRPNKETGTQRNRGYCVERGPPWTNRVTQQMKMLVLLWTRQGESGYFIEVIFHIDYCIFFRLMSAWTKSMVLIQRAQCVKWKTCVGILNMSQANCKRLAMGNAFKCSYFLTRLTNMTFFFLF